MKTNKDYINNILLDKNQLSINYWINLDSYRDIDDCVRDIIKIIKDRGY